MALSALSILPIASSSSLYKEETMAKTHSTTNDTKKDG
jgi:hypothetical protein